MRFSAKKTENHFKGSAVSKQVGEGRTIKNPVGVRNETNGALHGFVKTQKTRLDGSTRNEVVIVRVNFSELRSRPNLNQVRRFQATEVDVGEKPFFKASIHH